LFPSKVLENGKTKFSDEMHVSDVPVVLLADSLGIPLIPRDFLDFNEFTNLYVTGSYFSQRGAVYRCGQSLGSALYLPLAVFATQSMKCELIF
jgi:hypothetical protein